MKRQIISINEDKCNGCGLCVPGCPEGALQIIEGKARLVGDLFCDGLGACIGECPEGAITILEREAEPYNERIVMENIIKHGPSVISAHIKHLRDHNETGYLNEALDLLREKGLPVPVEVEHARQEHHAGCPGSRIVDMRGHTGTTRREGTASRQSELRQWPVQLHLINPHAPFLKNADLLVAADCVPFAYPAFHEDLLRDKILVIFCPKLDAGIDKYIEKLAEIFAHQDIKSVTVAHMEVPCCFGAGRIVETAMQKAGKRITIHDYTIGMAGGLSGEGAHPLSQLRGGGIR
ncbi:MAG TPA: 4Fe-4S binding protein [Spirochaetota bacterium]|nr:4Fe-4S binding protein [Spirochaetota bacterium]